MEHQSILNRLPGYDCGVCGVRTCQEFSDQLLRNPENIKRCIHLSNATIKSDGFEIKSLQKDLSIDDACKSCENCGSVDSYKDSLGRDFDFILDTFPSDPGPRETIRLHNPILVRELDIQIGDILIGRPMGMSCGCPVTHCGVAIEVDQRTGIIVWCITGPLNPRRQEYKDLGYYSAEAYEGLVKEPGFELKVGMRYWFMPHKCMLQWRHSGLVNFVNKRPQGIQVRIEGLFIG